MIGKDGSLISRTDDDHELSARRVRERERTMEISGASTRTILALICGVRHIGFKAKLSVPFCVITSRDWLCVVCLVTSPPFLESITNSRCFLEYLERAFFPCSKSNV